MAFGRFDPSDCQDQKVVHGSNCTLICEPGFEVKGPTVKTCGGKKSGIWSNRNKHPKCVGNYLDLFEKHIPETKKMNNAF